MAQTLTRTHQSVHLIGPGTYRVFRPVQAIAIGVSSEA